MNTQMELIKIARNLLSLQPRKKRGIRACKKGSLNSIKACKKGSLNLARNKIHENNDQLTTDWEKCGFNQQKWGLNQETLGNKLGPNIIRTGKHRKIMMSWRLTGKK